MGVAGTKCCDFEVWSSKEAFVIRISFDEHFWADLKAKLLYFHPILTYVLKSLR